MEIGLSGAPGPGGERTAVYVDLVFWQPMELARERGLNVIHLGLASDAPKSSRGAAFVELYGGVLGLDDVRALSSGLTEAT